MASFSLIDKDPFLLTVSGDLSFPTFQDIRLFRDATVLDNVRTALYATARYGAAGALLTGTILLLTTTNEPSEPSAGREPSRLLWEHDGSITPGFTVEQTTNLQHWETIGFVSVTNFLTDNQSNFTYQFQLTNILPHAFYRVGSVIP